MKRALQRRSYRQLRIASMAFRAVLLGGLLCSPACRSMVANFALDLMFTDVSFVHELDGSESGSASGGRQNHNVGECFFIGHIFMTTAAGRNRKRDLSVAHPTILAR